jgi:hypothetical protein
MKRKKSGGERPRNKDGNDDPTPVYSDLKTEELEQSDTLSEQRVLSFFMFWLCPMAA